MTPRRNYRRVIIDRAPLPLITHAHEIFLAFCMVLIGLALVGQEARPGSITEQVPSWMAQVWAWSVLIGGSLTMLGIWTHRPRWEWLGQIATGHGCGFYSLAVLIGIPFSQGGVTGIIFLGLTGVSHWRAFKITSSSYVQARINAEAVKASQRFTDERTSG